MAKQRASMEAVLGIEFRCGADLAKLKPADQILAIDLRDRDPDEVFSEIPYEKGRLFLNYLDGQVRQGALRCVPARLFRSFCLQEYHHRTVLGVPAGEPTRSISRHRDPRSSQCLGLRAWVAADAVLPVTTMFGPVDEARAAWLAGKTRAEEIGRGLDRSAMAVLPEQHARDSAAFANGRSRQDIWIQQEPECGDRA